MSILNFYPKHIFSFFIYSLTIFFSGCCEPEMLGISIFKESDIRTNPYVGNEVLKRVFRGKRV